MGTEALVLKKVVLCVRCCGAGGERRVTGLRSSMM